MKRTFVFTYIAVAATLALSSAAYATGSVVSDNSQCKGTDAPLAIVMTRVASHAVSDPTGLWSDSDIFNPNTPNKTTIWSGSAKLCDGSTITATQIINRQCTSATECPIRVQHSKDGAHKTVLRYEQVCTNHERITVRSDGAFLTACDVDFPLNDSPRH